MNSFLNKFDKNITFIYLIIFFQCLHPISLGSFTSEFLVQLIPYLFIFKWFLSPKIYLRILEKDLIYLALLNIICLLSIFWTNDIKFTLASNLELLLTSFTLLFIVDYSKNKKDALEKISNTSIFAIYSILILGVLFNSFEQRYFLGMSPSLFSSILNYGSVCSLFLFHHTNKKRHLISFSVFLIFNFVIGSIRGVFSIMLGLIAYSKFFKSKKDIIFYLKFSTFLISLGIILISLIFSIDGSKIYPFISSQIFLKQIFFNLYKLKEPILDIFLNNRLDLSTYDYSGDRLASFIIGIRDTFLNNPLIGYGHGNVKELFYIYGKSYSHNGLVDIYVGTGILGIYFYVKFLTNSFFKRIDKSNLKFLDWRRFSIIVFCVHLMLGLPFENIPLTLILSLIIAI